jgi:predicted transcriptional regulator
VQVEAHRRLAPGALRQTDIDHLTTHPGQAFTATRISRVIDKSSGAIANALVTLTKQGITELVNEEPRTYRMAPTPARTE